MTSSLSSNTIPEPSNIPDTSATGFRLWGILLVAGALVLNPWLLVYWQYRPATDSRVLWLMVEVATGVLGVILLFRANHIAHALCNRGFRWLISGTNIILIIVISALGMEGAVRVYAWQKAGPRALLHGTIIGAHYSPPARNQSAGYYKFDPYQQGLVVGTPRDPERKLAIRINNMGFRGEDVRLEKDPDVIRVIALGASSTFGYGDADDETYPYFLELELNRRFAGKQKFEVLNLGIPHMESEEIANLFVYEGVALDPDVVLFYEGINDSKPGISSLLRRVGDHILAVQFVIDVFLAKGEQYSAADLPRLLNGKRERLLQNLAKINNVSTSHDQRFLIISQQAHSTYLEKRRGITYEEEIQILRDRLTQGGRVKRKGMMLLIHRELMVAEKEWAESNGVSFVDGIAALDQRRDTLASYVHLDAEGNQLLAAAIADQLDSELRAGLGMEGLGTARSD